jgi:hypothetical protein
VTALSDALAAARAQAVAALGKAHIAGGISDDELDAALNSIGETDVVDQGYYLNALNILRSYGNGRAPAEVKLQQGLPGDNEPMTKRQRDYASQLANERAIPLPDGFDALTKREASELIEKLRKSEDVPF